MALETYFKNYLEAQNRLLTSRTRLSDEKFFIKVILQTNQNQADDHWVRIPVTTIVEDNGSLVFGTSSEKYTFEEHGDNGTNEAPSYSLGRSHYSNNSGDTVPANFLYNPIALELWGDSSYTTNPVQTTTWNKLASSQGEITGIEQNTTYIDSNDKIGGFSYTLNFSGYESQLLAETIAITDSGAETLDNIEDIISVDSSVYKGYVPKYIVLARTENLQDLENADAEHGHTDAYIIGHGITNNNVSSANTGGTVWNQLKNNFNFPQSNVDLKLVGTSINIGDDGVYKTISFTTSGIDADDIDHIKKVHFIYGTYNDLRSTVVETLGSGDGTLSAWQTNDTIEYTFKW